MEDKMSETKPKRKSKKQRPPPVILRHYSTAVGRTASWMWDAANDPFQVFKVEHEDCLDLEILVKNGEDITKGSFKDFFDIPDPYVILRVPGSANSCKRTSHVDNNVNPIWEESFHFFLDPKRENQLQVTLMDANHFHDETLGVKYLEISGLIQNVPSPCTFEFPEGSKVHTLITLRKNKTPDLRFSLSLCEEEKEFLRERRKKVLLKLQELLGEKGPRTKYEVPTVAVLGSGGGFRAMTCFSAATKALYESGILGCSSYISGLSGSSWFISTLYAHDKFPEMTFQEIYEDLLESVTRNWKWNLMNCHSYFLDMMAKYRRGQPVSFTDIFGHLLGDVLLKGKKFKTLSDQRRIVDKGRVPLPLYTCLHAKASVSCKLFSEWIEFSPYEIGIAKYGTFMKTENFGSKFLIGKLIKSYPEFPLHYLQGVWGSAFTILMKRLAFDGGPKQDLIQMMRDANEERAINEKLEEEVLNLEDDCVEETEFDTDDDVEGNDDKSSEEENEDDIAVVNKLLTNANLSNETRQLSNNTPLKEENAEGSVENGRRTATSQETSKKSNHKRTNFKRKGFSFDYLNFRPNPSSDTPSKQRQEENDRKISTVSDPGIGPLYPQTATASRKGLRRKGVIKGKKKVNQKNTDGIVKQEQSEYWTKRRKTLKERKTSLIQSWVKTFGFLNSRAGRAGEILNPFRGLSLRNSFPLSPFSYVDDESDEDVTDAMTVGLGCRYEALDNTAKKLFIVDSGLAFNSPYPLLLRPQRDVNMYLSFDFSQRPSDKHMPFKELLLAEKWAQQNKVLFPPIEKLVTEFSNDDEVKELYVFKHPDDPLCPVILHFTIVNNSFRWNKAPGVPRETKEELDFADFSLFDDPSQPYASTNFVYEPLQFERLFKLVEYNTLINIDNIKRELEELIEKKHEMSLKATGAAFQDMQNVLLACNKFKRTGNLSLHVNEDQRKQILLVCRASANVTVKDRSDSYEDNSIFHDALESLDSEEENYDDSDDTQENNEVKEDKEEQRESSTRNDVSSDTSGNKTTEH